jgi:hypothetical protein
MIHLRAGRQYRARLTGSVRWLVGPPDAIFLYKPESLVCGCPYSNWEKLKFLLGSQRTPTHLRFVTQSGFAAKFKSYFLSSEPRPTPKYGCQSKSVDHIGMAGSQRTPTHLTFVIQNGVEAKSGMIFSFSSRKQRGIVRTFGKWDIFRSPRNDRLLPGVMAERVCFGGETGLELARRSDRRF